MKKNFEGSNKNVCVFLQKFITKKKKFNLKIIFKKSSQKWKKSTQDSLKIQKTNTITKYFFQINFIKKKHR